ncbi:MAG: hypothetical protein ACKO2F_01710 [Cyanobacteriota bacterium]
MTRRSWLLLLAPALLATALPLQAEPVPIPTSSPFPIEGLMTRMLNQADVPPIARPLLDTLRRGLERGSLTDEEVTAMQRGLLGLIESLPAAMGGRP